MEQPAREHCGAGQHAGLAGEPQEHDLGSVFGQVGIADLAQAGRVDQVQVAPGHLIEPLLRPGLHIGAQEPSLVLPFVPPFALFSVCSMSAAARDRTKTVYPIGSVFGLPRVRVRMQQARLQAHGPQRRNVVFRTFQIRPRVATRNRQKSIRPLA